MLDAGHFLDDSDYYGNDLPFWSRARDSRGHHHAHLVVPYTLNTNDNSFAAPQGFNPADHFFSSVRDAFDVLYAEGEDTLKMLFVGLHCRLIGRPGRFRALRRYLDHIEVHDRVWVTRRLDIARHWAPNTTP